MAKRRKVSHDNSAADDATTTTEDQNIIAADDEDLDDDLPLFSSMEDLENARLQLNQRFEQGEKELNEQCASVHERADELVTKIQAKLKSHMFRFPAKIQSMKMSEFMREYDCSELNALLGKSGGSGGGGDDGGLAQDAPLGRYGTIKTPGRKKTSSSSSSSSSSLVPQTPMNSGTNGTAAMMGTFSVMKVRVLFSCFSCFLVFLVLIINFTYGRHQSFE